MTKKMIVFLVLANCFLLGKGQEVVDVSTQHGVIRGQVVLSPFGTEVEQFLGIPFAVPPIGSRRLANPELYGEFPGGLFEAFEYGYQCLQPPSNVTVDLPMSEDCLNMNIFIPRPVEQNRAVMVWIHGGAFAVGTGSDPYYDGGTLSSYGNVIVVAINYRLHSLGFFYTGDERMPNGNFGLLDQQLALRWIQENIAAFGGDPNQVTVFGESAGSCSVSHLMTLEGSDGLFNRVIMQSGTSNAYWAVQTPEQIELNTEILARRVGCSNDDTLLKCLRDAPAEELLALFFFSAAIIDGTTLLDEPLTLIESGQLQRKDSIVGFNKDEGSVFIFTLFNLTEAAVEEDPYGSFVYFATYLGTTLRNLTDDQIDDVIAAYEPANITDATATKIAISDMAGDIMFVCPAEIFAMAANEEGVKVYEYHLTYRVMSSPLEDWHGVVHGSDMQWMWGAPFYTNKTYEEDEVIFSTEIMAIWTDFAKYGYINDDWHPYTSEGASYAELRGPGDFRYFYGEAARSEKCATWQF